MTNRDYRLYELEHQKFEELCSKICIRVLGEGFVNFAQGKDGGKDGRFEGKANALSSKNKPYERKFIIQAKHTTNSCGLCSDNQFKKIIKKEIPKVQKLNTNYYFLLTNRKLTGHQDTQIQQQLKENCSQISAFIIWGKERIHSFLDDHRDLHEAFGFNKPRSPLNIRPEDLQKVIEEFRKYIPQNFSNNENHKKVSITLKSVICCQYKNK